jgi:uncharacterized membrane protein (DUF373 family)
VSETSHRGSRTPRSDTVAGRVVRLSEVIVTTAAGILVIGSVLLAAGILYSVFFERLLGAVDAIDTIGELQTGVERVFAGVLLLMLGLELLKSLKSYFSHEKFQVQIIIVVALIAIARHVMLIDLEHTSGAVLAGTAALILALAISYVLVRQPGAVHDKT